MGQQFKLWSSTEDGGNDGRKEAESTQREVQGEGRCGGVRGVKTVNEIAQLHGVHPVMVSQWKKEILAKAGTLFECKRGPKAELEHESEDRLTVRSDA